MRSFTLLFVWQKFIQKPIIIFWITKGQDWDWTENSRESEIGRNVMWEGDISILWDLADRTMKMAPVMGQWKCLTADPTRIYKKWFTVCEYSILCIFSMCCQKDIGVIQKIEFIQHQLTYMKLLDLHAAHIIVLGMLHQFVHFKRNDSVRDDHVV